MLQERSEMGQRQPADPERPFPAADPNEGPRGLQGRCEVWCNMEKKRLD